MTQSNDPFAQATPISGEAGDYENHGYDPGERPAPHEEEDQAAARVQACVELPLNDVGNGKRYLTHFGEDVFNIPRVGWHEWSGKQWVLDPDDIRVRRRAHLISDLIAKETWYMGFTEAQQEKIYAGEQAKPVLDEILSIAKKDRTEAQIAKMREAEEAVAKAEEVKDSSKTAIGRRLTHAKNAGNTNAIKNMLSEASVDRTIELEELDADPLMINTENFMLKFEVEEEKEEGEKVHKYASFTPMAHDRDQLLSKMMPVDYDPEASCPEFDKFIERIQPIPEMRNFLRRWLGLSMTALTGEQKFAFFYGSGANGKSVLMELIARIMGDYSASAKIETLTGSNRRGGGDATPDLMPLIGARFVRASEPEEGMRLQEALIKQLTGGEPMMARSLNANFVDFEPIFKLTIGGNHRPEIRGGDDGIWRRVLLVPFDVQIPPEERDPKLVEKLLKERSGILNWLVKGLLEYLEQGLKVPDTVSAATDDYREESDPYGGFLSSCCEVTGDGRDLISVKELGEAFNFWLSENGRGEFQPRTVANKLSGMAGRWKHPTTARTFGKVKSNTMKYSGIKFEREFGDLFRNMPRDAHGKILRGGVRPDEV